MKRARRVALGLAWAIAIAGSSLGCARTEAGAIGDGVMPELRADAPASLAVEVHGGLEPSAASPPDAASAAPAAEFRVIAKDDPAHVVATGRTGAGAVSVPPGVVTLLVDLDPLERIGPFRLEPGAAARVRILDTFDAALPSRIWRIERGDEVVGRAFPPPDELPSSAP